MAAYKPWQAKNSFSDYSRAMTFDARPRNIVLGNSGLADAKEQQRSHGGFHGNRAVQKNARLKLMKRVLRQMKADGRLPLALDEVL